MQPTLPARFVWMGRANSKPSSLQLRDEHLRSPCHAAEEAKQPHAAPEPAQTCWEAGQHGRMQADWAVPLPGPCPSIPAALARPLGRPGHPGSHQAPQRCPPHRPINLLLGEQARPFVCQDRPSVSSAAPCASVLLLNLQTFAFFPPGLAHPVCSRACPAPLPRSFPKWDQASTRSPAGRRPHRQHTDTAPRHGHCRGHPSLPATPEGHPTVSPLHTRPRSMSRAQHHPTSSPSPGYRLQPKAQEPDCPSSQEPPSLH